MTFSGRLRHRKNAGILWIMTSFRFPALGVMTTKWVAMSANLSSVNSQRDALWQQWHLQIQGSKRVQKTQSAETSINILIKEESMNAKWKIVCWLRNTRIVALQQAFKKKIYSNRRDHRSVIDKHSKKSASFLSELASNTEHSAKKPTRTKETFRTSNGKKEGLEALSMLESFEIKASRAFTWNNV